MVGFALWHVHPGFASVGVLSAFAVARWVLVTIPYAIARRREIEPWDWLMIAASVAIIVALSLPDTFFAM